jgi:hypothetical protein
MVGCDAGLTAAVKENALIGVAPVTDQLNVPVPEESSEEGAENHRAVVVPSLVVSVVERAHVAVGGKPLSKSRHW